jgi:hypothetical protein
VIAAAALYAASNVMEQHCVSGQASTAEVLAMLGVFGSLFNGAQTLLTVSAQLNSKDRIETRIGFKGLN